MMSAQAPGTKLTVGHKAPFNRRSPRPAARDVPYKRQDASLLSFVPSRCLAAPLRGGFSPLLSRLVLVNLFQSVLDFLAHGLAAAFVVEQVGESVAGRFGFRANAAQRGNRHS